MSGDAQDDTLVERARSGEVEAFATLYARYKADVWRTTTFTLRDYHEAEDALQETFIKAFRSLGQYHGDAFRPWLLRICRNACMDRLRARPRRATVSLQDDAVAEPVSRVVDQDRRIDFHRALEELAPEDREAFFLVDVMGCHSEEAARIVGVRAGSTLRSRVAKARRHLAPALAVEAAGPHAEIWGLYHAPPASVIVLGFGGHRPTAGNRVGVDQLVAGLRAQRARAARIGPARSWNLVGFLDDLDRAIPVEERIVAVLDGSPAAIDPHVRRWVARHPRWRLSHASSHASWLSEVDRLVDGDAQPLTLLRQDEPFLWTLSA